ncbi:hypothetical protein LX32DRAFT_605816, partial [Colletotrichum zoysiae]
ERVDCDCKYDCNSARSTTDLTQICAKSLGREEKKTPAAWDLGQESRAAARKPPCPRLLVCSVMPAAAAASAAAAAGTGSERDGWMDGWMDGAGTWGTLETLPATHVSPTSQGTTRNPVLRARKPAARERQQWAAAADRARPSLLSHFPSLRSRAGARVETRTNDFRFASRLAW